MRDLMLMGAGALYAMAGVGVGRGHWFAAGVVLLIGVWLAVIAQRMTSAATGNGGSDD